MKLFKNVLRDETLNVVNSELNNNIKKNVWGSNRRFWQGLLISNNLSSGVLGTILIAFALLEIPTGILIVNNIANAIMVL